MAVVSPQRAVELEAGEGLHVPAGMPHLVRNAGATKLNFILTSSPSTVGDRDNIDDRQWDNLVGGAGEGGRTPLCTDSRPFSLADARDVS